MIESSELSLSFDGVVNAGIIYFNLTDKLTGETNPIGFSLRYWQGYQSTKFVENQPSGAYIFRPTQDQHESTLYSEVSDIQVSKCAAKEQFVIWFTGSDSATQGDAVVTITIEDLPVLKYEV